MYGMVDCTQSPGVSYLECVPNRRAETLLSIIQRVCLPSTITYSGNLLLISE